MSINSAQVFSSIRVFLLFLLAGFLYQCSYSQSCSLQSYLEQGAVNSPALKDLSNQILANQYDSLITRATYLPQVNFNGYLMYAPSVNGWGYSDVITNGQQLLGTVNVNHRIFNGKSREATYEKFGIQSGSLANARDITVNELNRAVTAQYLAVYSVQEERNYQQEILVALRNEALIIKSWTEKGIYRQTDYLSLQVEIMNLERTIRDLNMQYRKETWNLNLICGKNDTANCHMELPSFPDPLLKATGIPVYLKQFRMDSLLIKNDRLLIDRSYQPVISWFADGGIINNEPRYIYMNLGISAGLNITLPLFDGNQRKINYDKLRIREETRSFYEANFRVRHHVQLNQLYDELKQVRSSMKENESQVALTEELVAADKVLLNIGSVLITDYILALKNLIEAKHAGLLYQIRIQYILNEINFLMQ